MAKSRYFFFESLRKIGTSLFNFFSRCEERGVMPRTARWVKTTFLGAFITGITALSAASMLNCIMCYAPIETTPSVDYIFVDPNPTNGTDSITVEATAYIPNPPSDEEYFVEKVICILNDDTTTMLVTKTDVYDHKDVKAQLYVGDLNAGDTHTIYVEATNNHGETNYPAEVDLYITESE